MVLVMLAVDKLGATTRRPEVGGASCSRERVGGRREVCSSSGTVAKLGRSRAGGRGRKGLSPIVNPESSGVKELSKLLCFTSRRRGGESWWAGQEWAEE